MTANRTTESKRILPLLVIVAPGNGPGEPNGAMERVELQLMLDALVEADWVQKDPARAFGIPARALNHRKETPESFTALGGRIPSAYRYESIT